MRNTHPQELQFYQTPSGNVPFIEWFNEFQDQRTQTRIQKRLQHLENGNYGDCQSVGDGVYELRLHFGAGYRIYFVKLTTQSSFCSVVVTNHRRHEILHAQKPIG